MHSYDIITDLGLRRKKSTFSPYIGHLLQHFACPLGSLGALEGHGLPKTGATVERSHDALTDSFHLKY